VFAAGTLRAIATLPHDGAWLAAAEALISARDTVNLALEPKVKDKAIGHRREASVQLVLPEAELTLVQRIAPDLAEALAVAEVEVRAASSRSATVARTTLSPCARCWRHRKDVGSRPSAPELCGRCASVLTEPA
jgi:isoleucyl-tRNA synthetase